MRIDGIHTEDEIAPWRDTATRRKAAAAYKREAKRIELGHEPPPDPHNPRDRD